MTALLDLFDEISCVFDLITKDQELLPDLIKLPSVKVRAIFEQREDFFTLQELKQILRVSEEALKDKKAGKLKLPATKLEVPTKTTIPVFDIKPPALYGGKTMTKKQLKVKTFEDVDKERRDNLKAKIEKQLSPFKDIRKVDIAEFLDVSKVIINTMYLPHNRGYAYELQEIVTKIKNAKADGSFFAFVKKNRQNAKRLIRLQERMNGVRAVFTGYGVAVSVIADGANVQSAVVRNLMDQNYEALSEGSLSKLQSYAGRMKKRSDLFAATPKFTSEHSEAFMNLYIHVRNQVKNMTVSEAEVSNSLAIPLSVFNSLRRGTFHSVTPNTLHALQNLFSHQPELLPA